uniref:hypothetical protein n=1 Tax=Pascua guehoae TaxID=105714 RepID=UPI00226CA0E9|nr:hypothetical protein OYX24_mgp18 [Pascua guehoae]UZC57699.1 hypothetical protein [Pascua guehoae]
MTNNLLNYILHVDNAIVYSDFHWHLSNSAIYEDNLDSIFYHIKRILHQGRNVFDAYLLAQLNHLDIDSFTFLQLVGGARTKYRLDCVINPSGWIGRGTHSLKFFLTSFNFNQLEFFRGNGIHIPPYYALLFNGQLLDFWLPDPDFTPDPSGLYYLIHLIEQGIFYDPTLVESITGTENLLTSDEEYSSDKTLVEPGTGWEHLLTSERGYSSDESIFGPGGGSGNLLYFEWRK